MKRRYTVLAALALSLAGAGGAGAASSWGLPGEEIARFEAKVVDILCELTGDCPANCGEGRRQLGLLGDDGTLVLAVKNAGAFTGAAADLAPFCGRRVVADGLFTTNRGVRLFALQFVREAPDGKWRCANRFVQEWGRENGVEVPKCGFSKWFRQDATIREIIEKDGVFGIPGLKATE